MHHIMCIGFVLAIAIIILMLTKKEGWKEPTSYQFTVNYPKYNPGPQYPPGAQNVPPMTQYNRERWVPSLYSPKPKVIIPTAKLEAAWTGPTSNPFVGSFQGQLTGGLNDITSLKAATPMQTKESEDAIFKTIL